MMNNYKKIIHIVKNNNNVKEENKQDQKIDAVKKKEKIKPSKKLFFTISTIIFQLICFAIIEIIYFSITSNNNQIITIDSEICLNFFALIPKLVELVLYSYLSVLIGNPTLIKKNDDDYSEDNLLNNYYKKKFDFKNNSLYEIIGNTYYYNLYYQIYIYQANINQFIGENTNNKMLPLTSKAHKLFDEKNNFCIYLGYYGYTVVYTNSENDLISLINKQSEAAKECRKFYNGANLDGINNLINVEINKLTENYVNFVKEIKGKSYDEIIDLKYKFYQNEDITYIGKNFINNIWAYFFTIIELTKIDIDNILDNKYNIDISFNVIIILFTLFLLFFIFIFIMKQMENLISLVYKSTNKFYFSVEKLDFNNNE